VSGGDKIGSEVEVDAVIKVSSLVKGAAATAAVAAAAAASKDIESLFVVFNTAAVAVPMVSTPCMIWGRYSGCQSARNVAPTAAGIRAMTDTGMEEGHVGDDAAIIIQ
jgi:hypothetical protein